MDNAGFKQYFIEKPNLNYQYMKQECEIKGLQIKNIDLEGLHQMIAARRGIS